MEIIGIKSNVRDMTRLYAERMRKVQPAVRQTEKEVGTDLKATLVKLSSGPFSTAWLRREARKRGAGLYSVRAPAPPMDASVINIQAGSIARGWIVKHDVTGDEFKTTVTNTSPHWKYMGGTAKMIARPIVETAQDQVRAKRLTKLIAEWRKALKK